MQTLLALKAQIAVAELHGDGNENGVSCGAKKIRAVLEGQLGGDDATEHFLFEFPEMLGSTLDAEKSVQPIELVVAGAHADEGHGAGSSIVICESSGFRRLAENF